MRYQSLSVLVAGVPGLTISVPYGKDEPIRLTLDRVTHKLADTAYGDPQSLRSLYLDGIRIVDYTKSIRCYGLFGKTVTYKVPSSVQENGHPVQFIPEQQAAAINRKPNPLSIFELRHKQRQSDATGSGTEIIHVKVVSEKGGSIKVAIAEGQTVEMLKTRISSRVQGGLSTGCQHLFFEGTRLEAKNTLAHYKMQSNATIYLLAFDSSLVTPTTLFIKALNGRTIICRMPMSQTVEHLKQLIQLRENIPVAKQCLMFERKYLEDNSLRLEDYGIKDNSTLYLTIRLRGGSVAPTLFADVSKNGGRIKKTWSSNAPDGRIACNGANIEVQCKCTKYRVIFQQGFGFYELNETPTACPNCSSADVTPITIGFSYCQYRIHGVKSNGERYKSEWMIVREDDQYQVYDDAEQVAWRRLGIESRPLEDSTDDPCTICLDDLYNATTLRCGHQFHKRCIAGWHMTCPNCRSPQL